MGWLALFCFLLLAAGVPPRAASAMPLRRAGRGPLNRHLSVMTRVLLALALGGPSALSRVSAQESANFTMERVTVTAAAERTNSASFLNSVTASPVTGSAGVCPSGVATATGFWSVLGDVDVLVTLRLGRSSPANDVELSWTGQADAFEVYRSTAPNAVESAANLLLTTPSCQADDPSAGGFGLLYYSVVPQTP